ncbi:hypothetical protein BC629DRAFT_1554369, partial [Irpex lacteus]
MSLPSQPIPVLLPISSLTSLASLDRTHAPRPRRTTIRSRSCYTERTTQTQNGTMVSLEINVGALGGAQASGLAVLLSALTSRGLTSTSTGSSGTPRAASAAEVNSREEARLLD